jgi:GT2 family glycosyltransferase
VVVATVGRAELTRRTVDLLADQTRAPDGVLVVGADPTDIASVETARGAPEVVLARRGSCAQRNHGIELLAGRADTITFFDDDFVAAPDYLEQVERLFSTYPDVVGVTGELIADGVTGQGFTFEEAVRRISEADRSRGAAIRDRAALYGCNMTIRMCAAEGLRFDEALPLYGWQEDIDFTVQLARRGRLISSPAVTGVHMGTKSGRTSGRRFGYSQVANLVYLSRKGTMQPGLGRRLLIGNLVSNALRQFFPEPHVDRHGRFVGNLIAIGDLVRGRIDPRRIEQM